MNHLQAATEPPQRRALLPIRLGIGESSKAAFESQRILSFRVYAKQFQNQRELAISEHARIYTGASSLKIIFLEGTSKHGGALGLAQG